MYRLVCILQCLFWAFDNIGWVTGWTYGLAVEIIAQVTDQWSPSCKSSFARPLGSWLNLKWSLEKNSSSRLVVVRVKVHTLDIAPLCSESPPQKRSGMSFFVFSRDFTVLPAHHTFYPQSEWAIPAFAFPAIAGTHLPTPEGWKAE